MPVNTDKIDWFYVCSPQGKVRKFIEYSDVERLLNAEIPLTVGRPGPVMLPIN